MIDAVVDPSTGNVNLSAKQGTTWDLYIILWLDSAGTIPFDLTNYSVRGQFRKDYKRTSPVILELTCTADKTGLANTINIHSDAADNEDITTLAGVYDVEVYTSDESSVERVLSGSWEISPGVTRSA